MTNNNAMTIVKNGIIVERQEISSDIMKQIFQLLEKAGFTEVNTSTGESCLVHLDVQCGGGSSAATAQVSTYEDQQARRDNMSSPGDKNYED